MLAAAAAGLLLATTASAYAAPAAVPFIPLKDEPAPKLFVDAPLPEALARGAVVIPYRTENFRILPVFGPGAVDVSPRAGHLHVRVDDLPWHWADAGDNHAVVVVGLPAGPHKLLIELSDPVHHILAGQAVTFTVPDATPHAH
jgi:hypothetical protein